MQLGEPQPAGDEDKGSSLQSEVNRVEPGKIERSADALQIRNLIFPNNNNIPNAANMFRI